MGSSETVRADPFFGEYLAGVLDGDDFKESTEGLGNLQATALGKLFLVHSRGFTSKKGLAPQRTNTQRAKECFYEGALSLFITAQKKKDLKLGWQVSSHFGGTQKDSTLLIIIADYLSKTGKVKVRSRGKLGGFYLDTTRQRVIETLIQDFDQVKMHSRKRIAYHRFKKAKALIPDLTPEKIPFFLKKIKMINNTTSNLNKNPNSKN
eukprot:Pgem_evm4s1